jgi:hypothetical protein
MDVIYCPKCSAESTTSLRYCRRCGTSLDIVLRALSETPSRAPAADRTRPESDVMRRVLTSDVAWRAIAGIVTLMIAIPCFLFMALVVGGHGGLLTLLLLGILLVFMGLGWRDLVRAYRALQDPQKVREMLRGREEERPASREGERGALPPPSVTEHTTYRLEKEPEPETCERK